MALLETHLKEIELCSSTISDLPFPPPKIFTNALLHTHDITALIRDTEVHERALFSLAPPAEYQSGRNSTARRTTVFEPVRQSNSTDAFKAPRRNTAVAAVLGGDMAERLRRERTGQWQTHHAHKTNGRSKDDIDVEFLLKGAEKLCAVYPISGAAERIATLRNRHEKVMASIEHYQVLVKEQSTQLRQMNRPTSSVSMYEDDENETAKAATAPAGGSEDLPMTEEDLRREEEGVRELERKKQTLEERVNGMEKDLGGILR